MTASLSYAWTLMGELWPHLEPREGAITQLRVADEESLLLIACVLPHKEEEWRFSLLLGETHVGKQGFASREASQQAAEEALTRYLRQNHLARAARVASGFDDPSHEVAAQLVAQLDDDMQIAHITEYKREWVAVCVSQGRARVEDYVFARDSDGLMGRRVSWDWFEGYDLGAPDHQCARATWVATVRFPSPRGEVGVDVFRDPVSRWHFGIDSSFLAQDVAEVIPNPFLRHSFLDISEVGVAVEVARYSAFPVPPQLDAHALASQQEIDQVRYVGLVTIGGTVSGRDVDLELFETGALFAIESAFLQRGDRTVADPFDETGDATFVLPGVSWLRSEES